MKYENIFDAITAEDVEEIKLFLPLQNKKDEIKALISAVCCKNKDILKILLESGIDPNQTTQGHSILYWVWTRDKVSRISTLVKHGLDINLRERDDVNAPHILFYICRSQAIQTVLNNLPNCSDGESVIVYKEESIHKALDFIKELVRNGVRLDWKDVDGISYLDYLPSEAKIEILDYAIKTID